MLIPFAVNVATGHGAVDLEVTVRYQVCSETECLPPTSLTISERLGEAPPP